MATLVFDDEQPKRLVFDEEPSVLKNAVTDIKEIGKGFSDLGDKAANVPLDLLDSINQIGRTNFTELPIVKDVGAVSNAIVEMPRALWNRGKEIASDPVGSFKERPVSTALDVASVAIPALRSAKLSAIEGLVGKATSGTGKVLRKGYNKSLSAATNVPEEAISALDKNPKLFKSAQLDTLATERLPNVANKIKDKMKDLSKKADDTLSSSPYLNDGAIPKDKILNELRLTKQSLGGAYSEEATKAIKAVKKIEADYKKLRNTVSQRNTKELIGQLDSMIPWKKQYNPLESFTLEENALINFRNRLDDLLKYDSTGKSTAYAKAVQPLKDTIVVRNELFKKFGIKKADNIGTTGKKYVPSDTTYQKLKTSLKEGKAETQRILDDVKNVVGEDLTPDIENALNVKAFESAEMKVPFLGNQFNIGGGVAKAGVSVGKIPRKVGKLVTTPIKSISEKLSRIVKSNPQLLGKYAAPLQKAAMGGAGAVAVADWVLQNNDPDYREMIRNLPKENEE